ncbi:RraA family protein [Ureibacillus sp. GCM10028918]|uniref:RraA family protein n=1 Tax=Ureibacillus sp. GCM10028918 TaxID=3273429 RepID=UPI0036164381
MGNIGMRIYTKFERPEQEIMESFKGIPTSVIADNMNRMYCMNSKIKPINHVPLIGSAFTIKTRPGDNLLVHKAIDLAKEGDILLVDAQGDLTNAIIGELMVLWAKKKGLGGFIIDGAIRDSDSIAKINFPVYAAGISPNGPYKDGPGEINVPVVCGGLVVRPGDIIVGDQDGVVVIQPQDAPVLLTQAKNKLAQEQQTMKDIENLNWDRDWVDSELVKKNVTIY